jgi:hypothetical protein
MALSGAASSNAPNSGGQLSLADSTLNPSGFGLVAPVASNVPLAGNPTGAGTAGTTSGSTLATAAPTAPAAASDGTSWWCKAIGKIGTLSPGIAIAGAVTGCGVNDLIGGMLGLLLIAAGIFTFRGTRQLITEAAKVA